MGGSKPPANTTSTTTQELPKWVAPFAQQQLSSGFKIADQPWARYPGQRVASLAPYQNVINRTTNAVNSLNADIGAGRQKYNTMLQGATGQVNRGLAALNQDTGIGRQYYAGALQDAQTGADASQRQLMDVVGGRYLDPESNPWLKGAYGAAARDVTDAYSTGTAAQTDAMAARAGAFGNSGYNEMVGRNQFGLGQNLSDLANQMYGGNYQQERDRQQQAAGMLPGIQQQLMAGAGGMPQFGQAMLGGAQSYMPLMDAAGQSTQFAKDRFGGLNPLASLAELQRGYSQAGLDEARQDWQGMRDQDFAMLDRRGALLAQALGRGGTSTITQPYMGQRGNPFAGALGGALAGGEFMQSNPWAGAAGGALLGGLSGMY